MAMIRQSTLQFNTSSAGRILSTGSILLRRLSSTAETSLKTEPTGSPPLPETNSNTAATFPPPAAAADSPLAVETNSMTAATVSPPAAVTNSDTAATFSPLAAAAVSPLAVETSSKAAATVSSLTAKSSSKATAKLSPRDFSSEVRRLCERLMILSSGDGSVGELLSRYKSIGKRGFLRCAENLRKNKLHHLCAEILEWMEKHGFKICSETRVIAIDVIHKTKGIEEAEKYFESISIYERNQYTYGALLHCYCSEKMVEKANKIFEEMVKFGNLSCLSIQNMMNSALTAGDPAMVISLADEVKRRNLELDKTAKIILIQCYKKTNDAEGYERCIDESEKDGESCHWSTYCDLVELCIKAGDFHRAEKALKRIEQVNGTNSAPFDYLIRFYTAMRDLDGVNRVWSILKSRVQYPSNLNYLVMLQSLLKLNEVEQVLNCFEEWRSGYKVFDVRIANVAIDCFLRQDRIEEAERVFDEAREKSGRMFFSGHETFMAYFLRERRVGLALGHLRAAVGGTERRDGRLRWQPPGWVVSGFWRCLEEEGDVVGAEELGGLLKKVECFDFNSHISFLGACLGVAKNASKGAGEGGGVARGRIEITNDHEIFHADDQARS